MRRSALFRGWAILWAVLQFALPASASVADAQLQRESATGPGVHVESTSTSTCHPSHPDECALCQFLSRVATAGHEAALPAIAHSVHPPADAPLFGFASRHLARVSLPRAPPRALA